MRIDIERDVMVPARDGVALATDIYRPLTDEPVPAVIVRLPYGKAMAGLLGDGRNAPPLITLAEAGYAVVWQDSRGTGRSEGEFTALQDEGPDGEDLLQWLTDQPWCNGRFGTYGRSYLGFTQWSLAASKAGGKLLAMVPSYTSGDKYSGAFHHEGGLYSLNLVTAWSFNMATMQNMRAGRNGLAPPPGLDHYRRLPLADRPDLSAAAPWYATWFEHPDRDEFWTDTKPAGDYASLTTPALHIGGWFDIFIRETLAAYTARPGGAGQRLLVGPWSHSVLTGVFPEANFGPLGDAFTQDITGRHLKFYDRWINGNTDALDDTKPVRIFVMGANVWRDEDDWPLPDTRYTDYHLHPAGGLSTEPASAAAADTYRHDPRHPVPTLGGHLYAGLPNVGDPSLAAGPADQSSNEQRDDVLCYTTDVLDRPVEVTGPIEIVLHAESSATDTDFIAKLIDVHPDGRAMFVTEGALRARYRESTARPAPLVPGQAYELRFELWGTSNVFLTGHRIRLEIAGSNFPRFDANTNTNGPIGQESEDDLIVAVNRIHHGPEHPSRLILPIIDR